MEQPTPGLVLEYVRCPGGARLVRVFGNAPDCVLPDTVGGLPLAELGNYCFADAPRESELPPGGACLREVLPAAGMPAAETHRIGGSFLHSVSLPDSLRTIGSCAFYNCRMLVSLSVGAQIETYGSDVFLNTFALRQLTVRSAPDEAGSLFRLVNSLTCDLEVSFAPHGETLAAVFYPEYWEDVEETPAHILLHNYSGQGYHYRQCFLDGVPRWAEYDAVFPMAQSEDKPAGMALLAFLRLRFPWELSPEAAARYRAFLAEHFGALIALLLQRNDTLSLSALLALEVLDVHALEAAADAAAKADNAAFAALLANALQKKQPFEKASDRYSFDF